MAMFYSDYQDIQLQAVEPTLTGNIEVFLINAGSAEIYGAEFEAAVVSTENLEFNLAVGYTHSEVDDVDPQDAQATGVQDGNVLQKTPEWSVSTGIQYSRSFDFGELVWRADYRWQDEVYHNSANDFETYEGSCATLDARVSLSAGDDWEFSLFGTNLTDEATYSTIFKSGAGFVTGYPNRSRVVGVNVTHHF